MPEMTAEQLAEALSKAAEQVGRDADRVARGRAERVIKRTRFYPPELPNSTYQRTGIYGDTFTLSKLGNAKYEMTSDAKQKGRRYSPFVGGGEQGEQQASIHEGRWPNFRAIADEEAAGGAKDIAENVIRIVRNLGL